MRPRFLDRRVVALSTALLGLAAAAAGLSNWAWVDLLVPRTRVASDAADLAFADGRMLYRGHPYSGHIVERDAAGHRLTDTPYRSGVKEGTMRGWDASGARAFARPYRHGRKVGRHTGWWPNGQLRFAFTFRDGEQEGVSREWTADGGLFREMHYRHGREEGLERQWNADGSLRANYVMKDGRRYGLMGSKPCLPEDHATATPASLTDSGLPYYRTRELTPEWLAPQVAARADMHRIGDFTLRDQNGDVVTGADLDGKIHVAQFFFVRCSGICPRLHTNLSLVQAAYHGDPSVRIVSYSVMPGVDNGPALRNYATVNHVEDGTWSLLTGDIEQIRRLARDSYFAPAEGDTTSGVLHSENLVLVDRHRRIRGVYNGTLEFEVRQMILDIARLEKES